MRLTWIGGCLLLFASMAFAQSDRGTITGTVSDISNAVIPGAVVVARNTQTAARYETVSTETGNYTIAQLPAGVYELSVEQPGFKGYRRQGITVLVAQTLRVDVVLEVGALAEQVTVTADATLLRTESGDLSHNIATDRLDSLPVLGIGTTSAGSLGIRNPLSSAQLIPGSLFDGNLNLKINGAPNNTYSIRVEGQEASNNAFMFATQQTQPSVDAVQEVSIQTSNYAAEFGQAGGGFFNYTMRSGTSQFHGSGYDNIVNEFLNAGLPRTQTPGGELQRDRQRRHDYGFNVGGPVFIPKVYDGRQRTFFFFNFEQFRESIGVSNTPSTVPTVNYRNGDFREALTGRQIGTDPLGRPILEGAIYDPATTRLAPNGFSIRDPFDNNIIPKDRWDPVAVNILKLIPNPSNAALINNFVPFWSSSRVTTIPGVKVDHTIGRFKISFYWSYTDTKGKDFPTAASEAEGFPDPITKSRGSFTKSHTESLNLDYSISPTLLWHLGVGYQHYNLNVIPRTTYNNTFPTYDAEKEIGLKGTTADKLFPRMNGLVAGRGGVTTMGPINANSSYTLKPSGNTSLSWVRKNHSYKFGMEFRLEGYPNRVITNTAGVFNFAADQTGLPYVSQGSATLTGNGVGFPFASFLLGAVSSGDIASPVNFRMGKTLWGFYAQDSWKVTRTLTVDYGLRYDYSTYLREQYGRIPDLSAKAPNPSADNYPGASIFEDSGPGRCNCDFARNYPYAFGPRLGAAWQFTSKSVLRIGWGISYTPSPNTQPAASSTNPFSAATAGDPAVLLQNGIPYSAAQVAWPRITPGLFPTVPGTVSGSPVAFDPNGGRPSRTMQWSIGVQHQLFPNFVVEAAYVGNRGVWWEGNSMRNVNALTTQRLATFGLDINKAEDRTLLTSKLNSALAAQRGFNKPPYPSFPTTLTVAQSLRPFPQFLGTVSQWAPLGNTWYDSLQVKATKRFSHGLDFTTAFTWQKELTVGTEGNFNDILDRDQNKYYSSFSRPLTLSIATTYQVPRFSQRWVSALFSDWRVGTVLQYASGMPIRVPYAQNSLNSLLQRNVAAGTTLSFANRVPGQPLFLKDLNCHCIDPNKDFVLNPKAWVDPPAGQFGFSPAYDNDYRYQRRPRESMSLGRSFKLTESGLALDIRVEFNNIFNRTYMVDPVGSNATLPQAFDSKTGNTSSGFGYISPTTTSSYRPREGLIIVKARF